MRLIVSSLALAIILIPTGCGIYTFSGASISPDIKTISIQTFPNEATLGPSTMSVTFTEKIKDYFQQNTSLAIVDDNGDLQIEGYIANYRVTPVAASASQNQSQGDYASLTRITIDVFASYVNTKNDEFDFEKTFSFFADFDQNKTDISSAEQQFTEEIFDQIIYDIFNASVANW
ncbi:MAG: LPS assembly lipoprotein LptE [Bacteroidota bacterium]